jgi:hypothetical protein
LPSRCGNKAGIGSVNPLYAIGASIKIKMNTLSLKLIYLPNGPGAMLITRIPNGDSSFARGSVNPASAAERMNMLT